MNAQAQRIKDRLLNKHSYNKSGVWVVKGEDPNCDMGGCHVQPILGYYSGCYGDVVEFAMELNGFFTWGGGGTIEEITISEISPDRTEQLKQARKELKEIKQKEKEIEETISILGGSKS